MIRYGDETWRELRFVKFEGKAERRDEQWVDVELRVEVSESTPLPDDLIDFAIVAVCTHSGHPMQIYTVDEDCDSEYQLTESEKEQVAAYLRSEEMQRLIRIAANGGE